MKENNNNFPSKNKGCDKNSLSVKDVPSRYPKDEITDPLNAETASFPKM